MVNFNLMIVLLIGAIQVGTVILLATEKESDLHKHREDVHPIATLMSLLANWKPKNLTFDLPVWNGFVASHETDYSDSNEPDYSTYDEPDYSTSDEPDYSASNEPDSANNDGFTHK